MAREYAPEVVSAREYAPEPAAQTFTPDEDTAYSAEGTPLVTPSTQAAPSGAGQTAANIMTDVVGAPVRAALSTAKPFADIAKWAGYHDPINALTQADIGIKKQSDWAPGIQGPIGSVSSLAGDVAGLKSLGTGFVKGAEKFAPQAMPYLEKGGEWLAKHPFWGQSVGGGAAVGVLGADPTAGSAVNQGLTGAVLGGATHGVLSGAGSVLEPALKRFQELKALGLSTEQILKDTTIGQVLGGTPQKIENLLGDLPFAGVRGKIIGGIKSLEESLAGKKAQLEIEKGTLEGQKTLQTGAPGSLGTLDVAAAKTKKEAADALEAQHAKASADLAVHHAEKKAELDASEAAFHKPLIDRALVHLGPDAAVPAGVTGHAAILHGQEAISQAYKDALKDIGNLRLTKNRQTDLRSLADDYTASLGGENSQLHNLLKHKIESLIDTSSKGKWLTPENWQGQLSSLSKEAYNAKTKGGVFESNYGKALSDLKDKWMDLIEGQSGSQLFKAANQAHSEFQIPQKAASYITSLKNEGEFNPNDLFRAIASETSTKRLAGGESELQQIAQKGYKDVMENRLAHKTYVADTAKHVENAKKADLERLKEAHELADKNIALRKEALKGKTEVAKSEKDIQADKLKTAIKDITTSPGENYAEKRSIYNLAGSGALTGGAAGLGHLIGLPAAAAISGATILGTRGMYSKPIQDWLKNKAVSERPEAIKQLGRIIKENTPLGALSNVESFQQSRKKPAVTRPGVQVINPNTGEEITPPKGGLP